ncbi:GntR family transcriptional regulator [Streptomyces sp. CA-294286]|uniref:GntR family transcriptional regulator n=1 Tax=Streptomyces sp. CA-294286 TaxID=3240070 RepID=UPI003D90B9F6
MTATVHTPDRCPPWLDAIEDPVTAQAARALHQHIRARCPSGSRLPTDRTLAAQLGHSQHTIYRARRHLETHGLLSGRNRTVLGSGDTHPDDIALSACVRDRIRSGYYQPGHALPTGTLGADFALTRAQVRRACRPLIAAGLLHDQDGPHGPGLYVAHPLRQPC